MKALITGGYGFIGSHVTERFYNEGYEVFIIDNLISGNPENVSCKHTAYRIDVEDKRCDEIFRNNRFDTVVHLAAQINVAYSIENPFVDTKSNILGLVNMLELSSKYKVKRFIFASSAAVYGNNEEIPLKEISKCDPLSPYGISKFLGEQYCTKWNSIYGLETVCLRFSNVYGPRQGLIGEGGVISIYMERLARNQELVVYGDGNQTRDFIYVSDVAEVIYRATESYITGIYNLSTNTQSSINYLIDMLKDLQMIRGVVYKEPREGDIANSSLDNTRVKKALDWVPKYQLKEGIKHTYDWYVENCNKNPKSVPETKKGLLKKILKPFLPYIENFILFLIVLLLNKYLKADSVLKIIDPGLIYIILMGITHGTRHSMLAVLLSSILFTSASMGIGRDLLSMILDTGYILHLSAYMIIGMVVGYTIDKRNRQAESDRTKIEAIKEKYDFLQVVYNETYIVKSELQRQILSSKDGLGKIYDIIKKLDSLESLEIYRASIEVLEKTLNSNEVAIYKVEEISGHINLLCKSSKEGFNPEKFIIIDNLMEAKMPLLKGDIFVNRKMNQGIPLFLAPIIFEGKLKGVISLNNVEFEILTLYYENLFRVSVKLINASVEKAYRYERAIGKLN